MLSNLPVPYDFCLVGAFSMKTDCETDGALHSSIPELYQGYNGRAAGGGSSEPRPEAGPGRRMEEWPHYGAEQRTGRSLTSTYPECLIVDNSRV